MTTHRSTLVRLLIAFLAGAALFVALLRALGLERVASAAADASPLGFLAFLAASTSVFVLYALRSRIVVRGLALPVDPSLPTLVGFRAASHAGSFLVPAAQLAGEPVRVLLFRRIGCPWGDAALAVVADRWMEATASAIAAPIYVAGFVLATDLSLAWTVGPILAWTAGSVGILAVYAVAARRGRLVSVFLRGRRLAATAATVAALESRFAAFLRSRDGLAALAVALATEAVIVVEFLLLFEAFGLDLPLPVVLGVLVGMGMAQLAPVPIGLGSIEGAQVGVAALAGRGAALGLAIGLLVRLRETLWAAAGLLYLWKLGLGVAAVALERDPEEAPST